MFFVKIIFFTRIDEDLNYIINSEKRITDLLKKLKNKNAISEETYNKLRPVGSKLGTLYGSAKVHKALINALPPFRPILSAIGTPTYKLAKFLVPVLSVIIQNEFTVKDSFTFVDDILTQKAIFLWLVWVLILYLPTSH